MAERVEQLNAECGEYKQQINMMKESEESFRETLEATHFAELQKTSNELWTMTDENSSLKIEIEKLKRENDSIKARIN